MDKQSYLRLRKSLDAPQKPWLLGVHIIQTLALASCIFASWHMGSYFQLLAPVGLTLLFFRGFSEMHEAVHGVAADNKTLNEWVGILTGGLCFLPFEPWKKSHLEHHYWSGNIEKDPVMKIDMTYPLIPEKKRRLLSAVWKSWFPILAMIQYFVFWSIAWKSFLAKPSSPRMLVNLLAPVLMWGPILYFAPAGFMLMAFAPAVLMYMVMVEVVNFPHHAHMLKFKGDEKVPIWEQYLTARTCLYPRWAARLVVMNFNYHAEHHVFPDVPWYHLEQVHELLKKELGDRQQIDPYFEWILKNKKLDLDHVIVVNSERLPKKESA